jgi:eukaryotic-like serine/threonine-protein kinase
VQDAQGDFAAALASYQASLAIAERLAKSDPSNADWQRDVSLSYGRLGKVHAQRGARASALSMFRRGQEIILRLSKQLPDNMALQKDLEWFKREIAAQK